MLRAILERYGKEIEAVQEAIAQAAAGKTTGADDKWRLDRFTRALQLSVQQRLDMPSLAFAKTRSLPTSCSANLLSTAARCLKTAAQPFGRLGAG